MTMPRFVYQVGDWIPNGTSRGLMYTLLQNFNGIADSITYASVGEVGTSARYVGSGFMPIKSMRIFFGSEIESALPENKFVLIRSRELATLALGRNIEIKRNETGALWLQAGDNVTNLVYPYITGTLPPPISRALRRPNNRRQQNGGVYRGLRTRSRILRQAAEEDASEQRNI